MAHYQSEAELERAFIKQLETQAYEYLKITSENKLVLNLRQQLEKLNNFLILPFHEVEKKVHEKAILEVGHGKRYRVNIKFRDEKVYLGNMDHEMGYFLDN